MAGAISTEVSNRNTAITNAINTEVTNRNNAIANAIANANNYIYAEHSTGCYWVDGRLVYKKTYYYGNIVLAGGTILDYNFEIPKGNIINIEGTCARTNGTLVTTNAQFYIYADGGSPNMLACYQSVSSGDYYNILVTVFYVK